NVRIRYRATMGGNLMARSPRYEMSALLTALNARLMFLNGEEEIVGAPGDLWSGTISERALLTDIAIPLQDHLAFFYDRTLRPTMTLALGIARGRDLEGRVVLATEHRPPCSIAFTAEAAQLRDEPQELAASVMRELPDTFEDHMTSHW